MKARSKFFAILMAAVFIIVSITPAYAAPSGWAAEAVGDAIGLGLVPPALRQDFRRATTRAEFAALAVALYESQHGPIEERMGATGRPSFDDTNDENVIKAAYLGIVSGVGGNRFNPHGNITREQAAVMVARLAEVVGDPLPAAAPTFGDNASLSSWAVAGVGSVQAVGIMGGTGNNMFTPRGTYTREQSIVTMLRLHQFIHGELAPPQAQDPVGPTPTPAPREVPFAYTTSSITIPNRRLTEAERQAWIDEYNANGGASAFELEVVRLVNVERANYGLAPLVICHTLMLAARFYAQTMANLNTDLSHTVGPYGGSFGTADAFGDRIVSTRAANGIAGFWTPESAVDGWMGSPGHRRNILNPNITRMGTGFHLGGQWGVFGYQLFGGGTATAVPD
ncbi:MAG: CAP domain-containing protein [Defluviitaleaceae bacterium]|nr:CAP domain-containing protein [Defluviitaleaceae bacterium]